jgi:sRNA-binding protein
MTGDIIMLPSARVEAVAREAFTRWPAVFDRTTPRHNPKPLCLRAGELMWRDLARSKGRNLRPLSIAQIGEALDKFLDQWVNAPLYLCRCRVAGSPRYDLQGQPWGEVTEAEAAWALAQFKDQLFKAYPMGADRPTLWAWALAGWI